MADYEDYGREATIRCLRRPELADDSELCAAASLLPKRVIGRAAKAEPHDSTPCQGGFEIRRTPRGWATTEQLSRIRGGKESATVEHTFIETLAAPWFPDGMAPAGREQLIAMSRRILARALRLAG